MRISVIIPTRERADYLGESIRSAIAVPDPDLEIVVSDNASEDHTAEVIGSFSDPRIKAINPGRRVSMRQNFEFALEQSTGDYILYIGDDDAILPRQFRSLRRVLEGRRPEALTWRAFTYGWPIEGFSSRSGHVRFEYGKTFGAPRRADMKVLEQRLLACEILQLVPMPAIYHGCASRAYLEKLRGPNGIVINSRIPDIYFSYRAILEGCDLIQCDHPFTLNGISPVSAGNAHKPYSETDARRTPAHRFAAEAELDAIQDTIPSQANSIELHLFATLETARQFSANQAIPDYAAWYGYVLAASRGEAVREILREHAMKTGTLAAFEAAGRPADFFGRARRKLAGLAAKAARAYSFKRSAESGGRNTVLSAAEMIDRVLGDDYARVLTGESARGQAWRAAWRRARV